MIAKRNSILNSYMKIQLIELKVDVTRKPKWGGGGWVERGRKRKD